MHLRTVAALATLLDVTALAAHATTTYTNAELLAFDEDTRLVSVRGNDGRERLMRLDVGAATPERLHAGDPVLLALETDADPPRIVRIMRSRTAASRQNAVVVFDRPPGGTRPQRTPAPRELVAYEKMVVVMARQAEAIDALWARFAASCAAVSDVDQTHAWFALWDGAIHADRSRPSCRDLEREIATRGERVNRTMLAAADAARRASLRPDHVLEVQRRHGLARDAWGLPALARRLP